MVFVQTDRRLNMKWGFPISYILIVKKLFDGPDYGIAIQGNRHKYGTLGQYSKVIESPSDTTSLWRTQGEANR